MPFITSGYTLVSADPVDIQMEIDSPLGGKIFVPIKSLSATKKIASTPEHHGGCALASGITQGAIDFEGSFSLGTWVTTTPEDAEMWEMLLYKFLIKPWDEGRSQIFGINQHQRTWNSILGKMVGGAIYRSYTGCVLTGDSFEQGESGTVKTTFPWMGTRRILGVQSEIGGQSPSVLASGSNSS